MSETEETGTSELDRLRRSIDLIDDDLVALFDLRAEQASAIARVKRATGARTIDSERERAIVDRLANRAKIFPESALREIYRNVFAAMIELQLADDAEAGLWIVERMGSNGWALKDRDRILLVVGVDEVERLNSIRDLHNAAIKSARSDTLRA